MALERFAGAARDVRAESISATSLFSDRPRASAMDFNWSQKAVSSDRLVRWPAMRTERLRILWGSSIGDGERQHYFRDPIICSGRTNLSKSSGVRKPSATAASFRLVPSAWAFFATFAALS